MLYFGSSLESFENIAMHGEIVGHGFRYSLPWSVPIGYLNLGWPSHADIGGNNCIPMIAYAPENKAADLTRRRS